MTLPIMYLFRLKALFGRLGLKQPKPVDFKCRPLQHVAEMINNLVLSKVPPSESAHSSSALHDQIHELIKKIEPYIYGDTPMCKALTDAEAVFNKTSSTDTKVLFILSDGIATDGDPRPIAKKLQDSGVNIVTCFLTSETLPNSKRLYAPTCKFDEPGRQTLFEMSSIMRNYAHTPVSLLTDAGWELPSPACLFIQANSLDVVSEFCRFVDGYSRSMPDS